MWQQKSLSASLGTLFVEMKSHSQTMQHSVKKNKKKTQQLIHSITALNYICH